MRKRTIGIGQAAVDVALPRLMCTVPEVAAVLSIGRSAAYELVACGRIPSVKIGKSRRVPVKALEDYIARLEEEQELGRAS